MLNADADPMWLDFRFKDEAGEFVWVGIFRLEEPGPALGLGHILTPLDALLTSLPGDVAAAIRRRSQGPSAWPGRASRSLSSGRAFP
jgi:hypothetical protein